MDISRDNGMYTTIPPVLEEEEYICDLENCKDCTFDCELNPNLKHIYGSDGDVE